MDQNRYLTACFHCPAAYALRTVATFQCDTYQAQRLGDHHLIIGWVLEMAETEGAPLIFHRGGYLTLPVPRGPGHD